MSDFIFTDPFDMAAYIQKRALEIEDLEERKLYKEVTEKMVLEIYNHHQKALQQLEKRVFDKVNTDENDYSISIGLIDRDHYDATDPFLFPIFPEDAEQHKVAATDIMEAINNGQEYPLYSIYVQAEYPVVKEFGMDSQRFYGIVKTSHGERRATFIVKKDSKYLRKMQELYQSFLSNGKRWDTVCTAYLEKMFTVYVCTVDGLASNEEINEITPNFEKYEDFIRYNMIPLWNIEIMEEKSSIYPVPCEDKINYEHRIKGHYLREDCSYLVSNIDTLISNIQRIDGDLTIISSAPDFHTWTLYKFNPGSKKGKYAYPVLTNQCKESFMNRLSQVYQGRIRTRAEISRIIEASNDGECLQYQGMELRSDYPDKGQTYDMESFIEDKIPFGGSRETILLLFSAVNPQNYLNYDMMSFLVTKVQNAFLEYHCVGEQTEQ